MTCSKQQEFYGQWLAVLQNCWPELGIDPCILRLLGSWQVPRLLCLACCVIFKALSILVGEFAVQLGFTCY